MITFFDISVIYLACGTPFGVYYFIQNRFEKRGISLWLGTLVNTLFWVPISIKYIFLSITGKLPIFEFDDKSLSDSLMPSNIESVKKALESSFPEEKKSISLFDYREILDRYCGLTLELNKTHISSEQAGELEIFTLSGHPDNTLARRCLQRRNLQHLTHHQILASKDLLKVFADLDENNANRTDFRQLTLELAMLLSDREFEYSLRELYSIETQIEHDLPVNQLENEVWISKQKPPMKATATMNTAISARALLGKD